ncbi:MAG TPA: hypothetical protein VGX94_05375 [Terriglobia bacterium]|nr:hypothetical protein [Terriglobia bacterium]
MESGFSLIVFADPTKAEGNLARLEKLLPRSLHYPLASLLAQSPDSDGALNLLERYAGKAPPETLRDLAAYPAALTYLIAIFGSSGFLSETFLSDPSLPLQFARDRNFSKLKSKEDLMQDYARFSTAAPDPWLSAQLGRFKQRTYLRIVLKDVLGISTLAETTLELSELADVLVTNALAYCDQELRKRYGEPQYRDVQGRIARSEFSVVSLGKLGGNELNYSSDIDLLFLYSHNGETSGGSEPDSVISNKEYFVRLASAVTRSITQSTPYGPVFRVDLRLRPEGDMGDMTISLKSALEYYEHRARDWELQMLIKARHSAGDEKLTRDFLRGVEGRIYGAEADFAAIETILLSREKISRKLQAARAETIDVKLQPGGIRDVEFLTQCLQRLHGGRDPWVRSGGTLLALRKLNDKGHLSDRDYAALTTAYEFLRKVEHIVQLDRGQQTHRLPADPEALDKVARRAGIDHADHAQLPSAEQDQADRPGAKLIVQLNAVFASIGKIYQNVIHPRAAKSLREDYALKPPAVLAPERAWASYSFALQFLAAQAPNLAMGAAEVNVPDRSQKNAGMFLGNLLSTARGFEMAKDHPQNIVRALQMIAASDHLAGLLIRHPEEIMALESTPTPLATEQLAMDLDPSRADAPHAAPIFSPEDTALSSAPGFQWILGAGKGLREQMALLRQHYRSRKLLLAGWDLAGTDSIFHALRRWSQLAAQSVSTALSIALQELDFVTAAGTDPEKPNDGLPFVVFGLGRLGIHEFDLASDADLMFVVASGAAEQAIEFWTRLAGKIIEVLSSYTGDGTLFAVDTRLRPLGQEGELVVSEDALCRYAGSQAQVWEGMAYLKIFPIAGNLSFGNRVAASLTERLLDRFSRDPQLEDNLLQMRRRLERELASTPTHLKTAPGGAYDIDYTLAYLHLRHHAAMKPGSNTLEQIRALKDGGLLRSEDAETLTAGASFLRAVDHAIRLVTGKSPGGLPAHTGHAAMVEDLMQRWGLLGTAAGVEPLAVRLRQVQQEVRGVYRRVVGSE